MMLFDFNLHLVPLAEALGHHSVQQDMSLTPPELQQQITLFNPTWKECNIQGGNLIFMNPQLSFTSAFDCVTQTAKKSLTPLLMTWVPDFRAPDILERLEQAFAQGVRSVLFHAYHQQITTADYPDILRVAQFVSARKGLVCIDTSYGTARMYTYDNLKLAAFISEMITTTPIILVHAGGLRILEAMLLADLQPNIYLETSFSVDYYRGSSIAQDFAFAFRKLGAKRILYGSDFPYVDPQQAQTTLLNLLEQYQFSPSEIKAIMYSNAQQLLV
jgi:predicted TIM-barrel fold metal-dependent hydrolase